MSVFKQFNSQDVIVSPLEVNKIYTFEGTSSMQENDIDIRIENRNSLYYKSIQHLYFSNYISGSFGEPSPGVDLTPNEDGTIEDLSFSPRYYNYLSTTLNPLRLLNPNIFNEALIISIPRNIYGDFIKPSTLILNLNNGEIIDDGNGSLFLEEQHIGNIIYEHGIIILYELSPLYNQATYNLSLYGTEIDTVFISNDISLKFKNSLTIFETQYKCTISPDEFNFTLNPSVYEGDEKNIKPLLNQSYFTPYITTVGIYNQNKELLAVGKLAKPIPISQNTDTTILINIDK